MGVNYDIDVQFIRTAGVKIDPFNDWVTFERWEWWMLLLVSLDQFWKGDEVLFPFKMAWGEITNYFDKMWGTPHLGIPQVTDVANHFLGSIEVSKHTKYIQGGRKPSNIRRARQLKSR